MHVGDPRLCKKVVIFLYEIRAIGVIRCPDIPDDDGLRLRSMSSFTVGQGVGGHGEGAPSPAQAFIRAHVHVGVRTHAVLRMVRPTSTFCKDRS